MLHLPVATVSLSAYINPIIVVLLGSLLLDEPFGVRAVVSAVLVLTGSQSCGRMNSTEPLAPRRPTARPS